MILFSKYFKKKNMNPPPTEKLLSRCNERLLLQKKLIREIRKGVRRVRLSLSTPANDEDDEDDEDRCRLLAREWDLWNYRHKTSSLSICLVSSPSKQSRTMLVQPTSGIAAIDRGSRQSHDDPFPQGWMRFWSRCSYHLGLALWYRIPVYHRI